MSSDSTRSVGDESAGVSVGIAVDAADAARRARHGPSIVDGAAEVAIEEVAVGEADVGLVAGDAGGRERWRSGGTSLGTATVTRATGRAVEGAELGRLDDARRAP